MRLQRTLALQLTADPTPLASHPSVSSASGVLRGDDAWALPVSVLLFSGPSREDALRRARVQLEHPHPAFPRIVDLGANERDGYVVCATLDRHALRSLADHLLDGDVAIAQTAPVAPVPAPKPVLSFDSALSAGLRGEEDEPTSPTGDEAPQPRETRAVPQVAWPVVAPPPVVPSEPAAAAPPPPTASSLRWLPIAIACATLGIVVGRVSTYHGADSAAIDATPGASLVAQSPTIAPVVDAASAAADAMSAAAPPVEAKLEAHPRPKPALLDVTSDVPARVELDGHPIGKTPITRHAIAAGSHALRVEALEGSMRLLPHEERLSLAAGEKRVLAIELR